MTQKQIIFAMENPDYPRKLMLYRAPLILYLVRLEVLIYFAGYKIYCDEEGQPTLTTNSGGRGELLN